MVGTAVQILITALTILIAFFAIIKTVLFLSHKTERDHYMFLMYFPEFDIIWTSDSRSKQKKKQQNLATQRHFLGAGAIFPISGPAFHL